MILRLKALSPFIRLDFTNGAFSDQKTIVEKYGNSSSCRKFYGQPVLMQNNTLEKSNLACIPGETKGFVTLNFGVQSPASAGPSNFLVSWGIFLDQVVRPSWDCKKNKHSNRTLRENQFQFEMVEERERDA
jgi:hypothetical protein